MAAQQLHASFPNLFFFFFPGFFPNTWQLPDVLSSAPILEQLLLLLQPASHTHSTPSKGERGASDTFSSVLPHLCPPPFAQEHPKQFYFHFSISIFGMLREKKNIYCLSLAHHLCHYCFFLPCVLYFLVRELFWVPTLFFYQCCCVCIPREAVADFHPIALTPVALGVSPVWSCTLRIWSSTFWGCTVRLMLEVKIFIYPVC